MSEKGFDFGPIVTIGIAAVAIYFLKDTLLSLVGKTGGTSDLPVCTAAMIEAGDPCRVASPFPFLPNVPVMPPDVVYVSSLCMYLGLGCPEGYGDGAEPVPEPDPWPEEWTMSSEEYWAKAALSGQTLEEACRIRAPTQMQFDLCMATGTFL